MIEVKNIHKSFGDVAVLKGITFQIADGEIVSIVGKSGAGKTTLLQILGLLESPTSPEKYGSVVRMGLHKNILSLSSDMQADIRNKAIGFVFQDHQLLPEFSVLENILMPVFISQQDPKPFETFARELAEHLSLTTHLHDMPTTLSGGERQRVAVIRAMIMHPQLLLADEPTGSLDSTNRTELQHVLWSMRERYGQTILIVTHDSDLARLSDRTLTINDGLIQ